MKTVCTKENLKKALSVAVRAVGSNTTLPILNNLLFKTENGQIQISSTNLEIAIKTWVGGKIEKPGEITLPAKTINDFITNLSDEQVTMETQENDVLVTTKKTNSIIKGLPADEFPLIPEVDPALKIELEAGVLSEAFSQVAFASAFSETQPELSGVLLDFSENELRIAATDRYRLAEKKIALKQPLEPRKVIVPNRAVSELNRALSEQKGKVELAISENQISFRLPQVEIVSRLIDGQYPDYQEIIPQTFQTEIKVSAEELATALKLSGLFAQENNNVELEIVEKDQELVLRATSQKAGSNTTSVKGEVSGIGNKIIFNYRYILDCLNHIPQKKVLLKAINSSSPAMIEPEAERDYIYLVMPIKT